MASSVTKLHGVSRVDTIRRAPYLVSMLKNTEDDGLLTRSEVARLLRMSTRSVSRLTDRGALRPISGLLPTVRYRAEDVRKLIDSKRSTAA